MANAARVHAIERGRVIGNFTMIAFGGGAPLHAGRLAQKLGIRRVVVPAGAGVGSAIGFLRAPIAFEVVRSDRCLLSQCDPLAANARLAEMHAEALQVVAPAALACAIDQAQISAARMVELRYAGQGHELRIGLAAGALDRAAFAALSEAFEVEYERVYGLRIPGSEVELVTWSLTLATAAAAATQARLGAALGAAPAAGERAAWEAGQGRSLAFGLHWRFDLTTDRRVVGPALIAEHETTTVVPAGWSAQVDSLGHLILEANQ